MAPKGDKESSTAATAGEKDQGKREGGLSPPTPQSKQATAPSPRLTSGQGVYLREEMDPLQGRVDRVPSDRSSVGIGADMRVKALLPN